MGSFWRYLLVGVLFWVAVDYTTSFNPDFSRWLSYMPQIWLFYIGYPLIFSFLIYKRKLDGKKTFYAMIIASFIVEVPLSNNALLYTFPVMLIMVPLALCIYSFITFAPKWIVEGSIQKHKREVLMLTAVWIIVSFLNFATKTAGL